MQSGGLLSPSGLISGATAAIAVIDGIKAIDYFLQPILGKRYSKKNLKRLREVTLLYDTIFKPPNQTDPQASVIPEYWRLNEGRPVFCYAPVRRYDAYLSSLEQSREGVQNYNKTSKVLSKFISSYLGSRQNRYVDNGSKGDFLELFFNEWLMWSATELPHYEYDQTSIEKFEKKLKYLEAVRKQPNLLPHSKIPGKITKHDTLDFIERELHKCIAKTKEEMERKTAHDHFKILKDKSNLILDECFNFIFYDRQQSTHEIPLVEDDYVTPSLDASHAEIVRSTLPKIAATHTGEMLKALIMFSRSDNESVIAADSQEVFDYYFNLDLSPKPVKWDYTKCDMPSWIPKSLYHQQMQLVHELSSLILEFIKMKRLIDNAYTLCTYKGTLWAYGSKQGKESIEGLLHAYVNVLSKLFSKLVEINTFNNTKQRIYNRMKKKDYDEDADFNLKNVNDAYESVAKLKKTVISTTKEIKIQIQEFPINMAKRINNSLIKFYRDVRNSLLKHTPNDVSIFTYNDTTPLELESELNSQTQADVSPESDLSSTINIFNFSFYDPTQANRYQNNEYTYVEQSIRNLLLSQPWKLGDNYDDWRDGFFIRNKEFFDKFKNTFPVKLTNAFLTKKIETIDTIASVVRVSLETLIKEIREQRPRWRIYPLTLGWPFNQKASKFAEILIQRLEEKTKVVEKFIREKKVEITNSIPLSSPRPSGGIEHIYQRTNTAVLKALQRIHHDNSNKSTQEEKAPSEDSNTLQEVCISSNLPTLTMFEDWRTHLSDLINDWAVNGFSTGLTIFANQDTAKDCLANLVNCRLTLGENISAFLELCDEIKELCDDILKHSEPTPRDSQIESIDLTSKNQLNLVLKMIDVLRTIPNSIQYDNSIIEFNRANKTAFIINPEHSYPYEREERKEEEPNHTHPAVFKAG